MQRSKIRHYLVFLLSISVMVYFVYSRREDLATLPGYFQKLTILPLSILFFLEISFLIMAAQSNRLIYRAFEIISSVFDQVRLMLAAGAIERLLPSGGAAGMSSFVLLARRLDIPVHQSIKMTATSFVLGYVQIVPLLFVPLFFINSQAISTKKTILLISVSSLFVLLLLLLVLLLGSKRLFQWAVSRRSNTRYIRTFNAILRAHQYIRQAWQQRSQLVKALVFLWLLYPVRVLMLHTSFAAFHVPISWSTVWAGYSISILLSFLTFLPTTLGVFELSMVGTFALLGIATDLATAVTLLYRVFTYWLPLPMGVAAWWNLGKWGIK